jgi:hypothetical protein
MRLSAILLARFIAFLPVEDLTPRGDILGIPESKKHVERYGFLKYPDKIEEFLDEKGITFELGKWGDVVITKLSVLPGGFALDTRSSTDDSERILSDILVWSKEALGFTYDPSMITHKMYVSQVTFTSGIPLSALNPRLDSFATRLTRSVSSALGHEFSYEASGLTFGYDTMHTKPNAPFFIVERRENVPYSDNKYFSSAPLSTSEHLALLEEFEAALQSR